MSQRSRLYARMAEGPHDGASVRRWPWALVVGAFCWLSAVPVLRESDFPYFDGAYYFNQALSLARDLSFANVNYDTFFNPLFTLFGAGLIAILPFDALHVYFVQILGLYTLFGVLLFLVLAQVSRPWVAAFMAITLLASGVVLKESIHGIHLFSACWLAGLSLIVVRGGSRSLPGAVAFAGVGIFVRPEFLMIALGLAALQVLSMIRGRLSRSAVLASSLILVLLLGLFAIWKPASERGSIVLCQSYEWNVLRAEGGNFDPSRCAMAFPRDFGEAESIPQAMLANPGAFMTHVVRNVGNFWRALGSLAPMGPSASLAGILLLATGTVICLLQLFQDVADDRSKPAETRVSDGPTFWWFVLLVTLSVIGPLLIAQSHPKYLFGLLPLFGVVMLTLLKAGIEWLQKQRVDVEEARAARAGWVARSILCACIASFLVTLPVEARRGSHRGLTGEERHFAPISARLGELSLAVSDVTIAGHSAASYATMLRHDRPEVGWHASSSLSAEKVSAADVLVLHPRFVRNVVAGLSEDWLRETLESGDYIRASHAGWPEVTVYVRRTILARM